MNYIALGRQIRKHRQLAGFTQERLADSAEISPSFLGHIERGSRKASLESLVKIANVLDIGVDALLMDSLRFALKGRASEMGQLPPEIREAFSTLFRLVSGNLST